MTIKENKKRIRAEAFNAILKIHNPKHSNSYSNYQEDGSYAEQRDEWVGTIIRTMDENLVKAESVKEWKKL